MENEKKDCKEELSVDELRPGRLVTAVRSPNNDYEGYTLEVITTSDCYVVLKRIKPRCIKLPLSFWVGEWGFADASILDKPKTVWMTTEEVEREGKKSLLAAVEVSIKKYRQIYEAADEELNAISEGRRFIWGSRCGLCRRFSPQHGNTTTCKDCLLYDSINATESCCPEWRTCRDAWGNWPIFRPSVLKMIERLEMERDKLLKPKPYVFQIGDVVENSVLRSMRIICSDIKGGVMSININGTIESHGQESFEDCSYKKIGVLRDFINRDRKG